MISNKKIISKLITSIVVSSSLILYFIFFVPAEIYISNPNEFHYILDEIIPYLLIISIVLIIIFSSLIALLNHNIFKIALTLATSLIILVWLEGNIFYKDYGPLDGREIMWDNWKTWGYIDVLIWLVVFLISIYLRNYIFKYIRHISIVLILTLGLDNFSMLEYMLSYGKQRKKQVLKSVAHFRAKIQGNSEVFWP